MFVINTEYVYICHGHGKGGFDIAKNNFPKNIFSNFINFQLVISSMALHHSVFLERHVAIRERHASLLIFRRRLNWNYGHVAFNPPRPL